MNLQRLTQENKNLKAQNKELREDLKNLMENKAIILEKEKERFYRDAYQDGFDDCLSERA